MAGKGGVLVVVLLSMALLAGCASEKPKTPEGIQLLTAPPPEAGKGSISGVVVDEAIRPLGAANITVSGQGETATTDDGGLFLVTNLEPGLYTLTASRGGYLPIQTTAEVQAGQTAKVRIVLARDLTPQPYHTTLAFDWYDEAGVTLVDFAWDLFTRGNGLPALCDRCYFEFITDGPVEEFVIEATWEDTVPAPHKDSEFYWTLDNLGEDGGYESDYFYNPGRAAVGGNRFGNSTQFAISMTGEEEWITYQQTARLFVTLFYIDGAPQNWSFIAGDR